MLILVCIWKELEQLYVEMIASCAGTVLPYHKHMTHTIITTTQLKQLLRSSTLLSVAAEDLGVAPEPVSTDGWAVLVEVVSLADETAIVATSWGQTTQFTVLHVWLADPVDASIVADGVVHWVNEDDLVELVGGILVNPVAVQHTKVSTATSRTLLSNWAQVTSKLELVDTLVLWLSVNDTLWDWALTTTTTNANTVYNVALLGLVA